MPDCADIAVALLAAGAGTRFGGNKLEARMARRMLGEHAAQAIVATGVDARFAVHDPAHGLLAAALEAMRFTLIANPDPARGLSHSLRLAVAAVQATEAQALMIVLGDMPRIDAAHLTAIMAAHAEHPDRIIASCAAGARTPPALFPRAHWSALRDAQGDSGARALLATAITVETTADRLVDVDTATDLNRIAQNQR